MKARPLSAQSWPSALLALVGQVALGRLKQSRLRLVSWGSPALLAFLGVEWSKDGEQSKGCVCILIT